MKRKRLKIIFVSICCLFITSNFSCANTLLMDISFDNKTIEYSAPEVYLKINSIDVITKEMPPIIMNERTLVPARETFEQMGATVKWIQESKEVDISMDEKIIILKINETKVLINDKGNVTEYNLDVPAKIMNNKTMIPLRFVAEALDFTVDWNNDTRVIDITIPEKKVLSEIDKVENNDKESNYEKDKYKKELEDQDEIYEVIDDEDVATWGGNEKLNVDLRKKKLLWKNKSINRLENTANITKENHDKTNIYDIKQTYKEKNCTVKILTKSKISNVETSLWNGKLILDVKNSVNDIISNIQVDDNNFISTIRTSQFTKEDSRIVFDLKNSKNYHVSLSKDRKEIIVNLYKNDVYSFELEETKNDSIIKIETIGKINVNLFRLTSGNRLVVDVLCSSSSIGKKEAIMTGSENIKSLRTSQFDNTTTRFVIELNGQRQYEYKIIDDNCLKINIFDSKIENALYENDEGYRLNLNIEDISKFKIDDIEVKENYFTNENIIILPDDYSDIFNIGKITTNDKYIKDIEFYNDERTDNTCIKINSNKIIAIDITKKKNEEELILNFVLPGEKYDKVIVLDPGHGGDDPGANVKPYKEKDYNLKIAEIIKNNLEDEDIKVYMTRIDDTFIQLKDRADLANNIKADIFLSLHNNAMESSAWNGTEVLYNDSITFLNNKTNVNGLTNKEMATRLATAISKNLNRKYKNNNTEKRNGEDIKDGISLRKDLAVLKVAKVPASLIELAFMTNKEDLERLNNDNFINKACEVIANEIIDIFDDNDL